MECVRRCVTSTSVSAGYDAMRRRRVQKETYRRKGLRRIIASVGSPINFCDGRLKFANRNQRCAYQKLYPTHTRRVNVHITCDASSRIIHISLDLIIVGFRKAGRGFNVDDWLLLRKVYSYRVVRQVDTSRKDALLSGKREQVSEVAWQVFTNLYLLRRPLTRYASRTVHRGFSQKILELSSYYENALVYHTSRPDVPVCINLGYTYVPHCSTKSKYLLTAKVPHANLFLYVQPFLSIFFRRGSK